MGMAEKSRELYMPSASATAVGAPVGVEGHWSKGVAEDVAEELSIGNRIGHNRVRIGPAMRFHERVLRGVVTGEDHLIVNDATRRETERSQRAIPLDHLPNGLEFAAVALPSANRSATSRACRRMRRKLEVAPA